MKTKAPKTGFDRYFSERMKDRGFAAAYKQARERPHQEHVAAAKSSAEPCREALETGSVGETGIEPATRRV